MRRINVILGSNTSRVTNAPIQRSIQVALSLAIERFGDDVEAYTVRMTEDLVRYALAAGVASVRPLDEALELNGDLVFMGGDLDPWGEMLPSTIAERLHCAMVFDVLDAYPTSNGIRVVRDVGRGAREELSIAGRAVLCLSEQAPRPKYISRYRRRSVDILHLTRPISEKTPASSCHVMWQTVTPRVKLSGLAKKTGQSADDRMIAALGISEETIAGVHDKRPLIADAWTCAQHLLRYLSHHGFIERVSADADNAMARDPISPAVLAVEDRQPVARLQSYVSRGPRALNGTNPGFSRRPRHWPGELRSRKPALGCLARIPRPVGHDVPQRVRGPFPHTMDHSKKERPDA